MRPPLLLAAALLVACGRPAARVAVAETGRALPARQVERLGRGVVAVHEGGGRVFVSWRLLATDPDGREGAHYTQFIVYDRLGVAWQNVAYDQPPHVGSHLGVGMRPHR